jgi:hypothetical protein
MSSLEQVLTFGSKAVKNVTFYIPRAPRRRISYVWVRWGGAEETRAKLGSAHDGGKALLWRLKSRIFFDGMSRKASRRED